MGKGRLEAFSDGVLAIIITIMVLGLKVPHGETIIAARGADSVLAQAVTPTDRRRRPHRAPLLDLVHSTGFNRARS